MAPAAQSTGVAQMYGLAASPVVPPTPTHSELHALGGPSPADQTVSQFWHPGSPLFWLFGIAAVTFGLIAVSGSGSVAVGPFHASASAGAGKK